MNSPRDPQLFVDEDFRFRLGTIPGEPEEFFARSVESTTVLAERKRWLANDPARYAAILPEGTEIVEEFLEFVCHWKELAESSAELQRPELSLFEKLLVLGRSVEPDFVLLVPRSDGQFTVAAGCVCFPSSWRLTDKLGQTVSEVHEPVPNLNVALGQQIDRLLQNLRPGKCVIRANWSVCRQPELNQHLDRNLPGMTNSVTLDQAWFRREDQSLFVLPETRGIVFGIRVTHLPWQVLRSMPEKARSVARTLQTMPPEMLDYKRLTMAWEQLAGWLTDSDP
ncbi:MAG: heme-dependent oxidative N-demethylase subunit alpha family protein [Planctomycetota bacterium]